MKGTGSDSNKRYENMERSEQHHRQGKALRSTGKSKAVGNKLRVKKHSLPLKFMGAVWMFVIIFLIVTYFSSTSINGFVNPSVSVSLGQEEHSQNNPDTVLFPIEFSETLIPSGSPSREVISEFFDNTSGKPSDYSLDESFNNPMDESFDDPMDESFIEPLNDPLNDPLSELAGNPLGETPSTQIALLTNTSATVQNPVLQTAEPSDHEATTNPDIVTAHDPIAALEADNVRESGEIRVVIDGELGTYQDVPIRINERILLPFREILVKLGVPNDDSHIIWNETEESVTIKAEIGEIKLIIGSPTIMINGVSKTFDVAPYFYEVNNRTYVPVRAVSEIMDKLVHWEEETTTAYIRDKENYEETKRILQKERLQKEPVSKYKAHVQGTVDISLSSPDIKLPGEAESIISETKSEIELHMEVDSEKGIMRIVQNMNDGNSDLISELYLIRGKIYYKGPGYYQWTAFEKTPASDFNEMIRKSMAAEWAVDTREIEELAMGLRSTVNRDTGSGYILSGELVNAADAGLATSELMRALPLTNTADFTVQVKKHYIQLELEQNCTTRGTHSEIDINMPILMHNEITGKAVEILTNLKTVTTVTYKNVGEDFEITIPHEITELGQITD